MSEYKTDMGVLVARAQLTGIKSQDYNCPMDIYHRDLLFGGWESG